MRGRACRSGALTALLVGVGVAGCGLVGARTTHSAPPRVPTASRTHVHSRLRPERRLAFSRVSGQAIQSQPPAGSCHAIGAGGFARPDPRCTPGALNPAVTQATIDRTICRDGWTSTVRPPERVTEAEKQASMAAYGNAGPLSAYEYDHLVPLELGGAVNDPRNLWPEPGGIPNPKDAIETELNQKVCDGQMSLSQAQHEIAANWTALASRPGKSSTGSSGAAHCRVRASYNSAYHDYDVYISSNQPDRSVTVSDSSGTSATWHTDSRGYADVYLHAGADARGEGVRVKLGRAACSTTL